MDNKFLSQILSLVSVVLIPFIPNNTLRYIALVIGPFSFFAYLVYHNIPSTQLAGLDTTIKELDKLLSIAVNECARNPRFIYEAGLKLAETKLAVSDLRTRIMSMKFITLKTYPYHLRRILHSIDECRRDIKGLRASISLALELARQQKFQEDINQRKETLESTFSGARRAEILEDALVESPRERPNVVFECVILVIREQVLAA
ncbi:hypothetical protein C8R44DRAFT_877281 [Mycena epipterygia]|nr:hypothetical protein C8R44DRAFT_877281 [Mycena epipterygia]